MSIYDRYILPPLLDCACGVKLVREERAKIVPLAEGEVLEIGIGSGLNLPLYDRARVKRLVGLDPSEPLLEYTRRRMRETAFPVELMRAGAEHIALPSGSLDTVVSTFTLCTIPDADAALAEARRVLKPDGKLLFLEHGLAPDEHVRRWQHRLTPLWRRFAGGCHLDRDMPSLLRGAGFAIQDLAAEYLPHAPRFVGFAYRGIAVPA